MRDVERSLGDWLGLYNELREAERLLGEAEASAGGASAEDLRTEVARLRAEVDQALAVVTQVLASAAARRQGRTGSEPPQARAP